MLILKIVTLVLCLVANAIYFFDGNWHAGVWCATANLWMTSDVVFDVLKYKRIKEANNE